jgi:hypothetical protein
VRRGLPPPTLLLLALNLYGGAAHKCGAARMCKIFKGRQISLIRPVCRGLLLFSLANYYFYLDFLPIWYSEIRWEIRKVLWRSNVVKNDYLCFATLPSNKFAQSEGALEDLVMAKQSEALSQKLSETNNLNLIVKGQ